MDSANNDKNNSNGGEQKTPEFCHDFQNSNCSRRNCRFIHCTRDEKAFYLKNGRYPPNNTGGRGGDAVAVCRDFVNGKCTRGASCKFRHESQGDLEHEGMRGGPAAARGRAGWDRQDDHEYEFERSKRVQSLDAFRARSRYGRPSLEGQGYGGDYGNGHSSSVRDLENDNTRLRQKIELLSKQVDDLTSTNEVLLQQNAQLRTRRSAVAQPGHLAYV